MSGCLRAWETDRGASGRTQKGIGKGAGLRTRTRAGPRGWAHLLAHLLGCLGHLQEAWHFSGQ